MSVRFTNRPVSLLVIFCLAMTPLPPLQAMAPQAKPAAAAPAAKTPAAAPRWPRTYNTPSSARVTVFEPQISSWTNQRQMTAYAAASYQAANSKDKPLMGTIRIDADSSVSLDERLVNFAKMRIVEANFPGLPKATLQEVVTEITRVIPPDHRVIDLDTVLAFVDKSTIKPKDVPGLKADPPKIFFSQTPAILVNFDGEPIWSPIEKNDLKFAVNTNWDLFHHQPSKAYFLRHDQSWFTAMAVAGPWSPVAKQPLPASFSTLPATDNFKEARAAVPAKTMPANQRPTIFVSFEPAELILLRDAPSYLLVQGTKDLLWVTNTESDVFRMRKDGPVYFLVAGRWFSAPDFTGPWTFATPKLPDDFKRIPLEHDRSRVLASVPGTEQAIEAILIAQVPQTARVSIKQVQAPPVGYQGVAEFAPIEGTTLQRAVNTDKDIIFDGKAYYYCYQGVWFTGPRPDGPYVVATTIPASIYSIPASSPVHHVTYVTIEEDDDSSDEWLTFAYVAGYTGLMIGWGCAVWGSGWYYPPYAFGGIYYPHFPTYGYGARYNPWTGSYGRGMVAYGPYGGVGAGARYNPRTGSYARGAVAWGPYGASGAAQAWNPRTGGYGQTRQGSNVYGSWGSSYVQRGDDWAQTNRVTNRATGATTRVTRTDDGAAVTRRAPGPGGGFAAVSDDGDVYAGRDGNVYRKDGDSWQRHENGNWGNVDTPTPRADGARAETPRTDAATVGQLDRDRDARSSGAQRTQDYGTVKSSGGATRSSGSGSYRGGGGASRGGGGRRR
jgi:hypothetical protein